MSPRSRCLAAVVALALAATLRAGSAGAADTAPLIVFDLASGTGPVVRSPGGAIELLTVAMRDSLDPVNPAAPPRDTIPSRARLDFRWHAEPTRPGSVPVAYRYKLDEADFVTVDATVTSVSYNTGVGGDVIAPGTKLFTLRVVDDAGLEREITRRFRLNLAPDTWFAGPDVSVLDARFGWSGGRRVLDIADWHALPDLSGSLLGCDSLTRRPAERAAHRTFFEIYGDRLYVRAENDTVHMNSWVVVHGGGADLDSPYLVKVDPTDPALADTIPCAPAGTADVVRPAGLVGSPIGFRYFYTEAVDLDGQIINPAQSLLFPVFDPFSPFRSPVIASYVPMFHSGKVYFVLRSEDSDGELDRSIPSASAARTIADHVDGGVGTPEEIRLRGKILTFYVNRAPYLLFGNPVFVPRPYQAFPSRTLMLNLLAADDDPYDPAGPLPRLGGPSGSTVLRWTVTIRGLNDLGADTTFAPVADAGGHALPVFQPQFQVSLPPWLVSSVLTVQVQLCDCADCEVLAGSGRCVNVEIPIQVPPPVTATLASLIAAEVTPEGVRVRWHLAAGGAARVERRTMTSGWQRLGDVLADGDGQVSIEDAAVEAGGRYAYRLALGAEGQARYAGEVWVDVPARAELALEGLRPNPSVGGEHVVRFSLASTEPARLEILDLSGRRLATRDLGALGPGQHALALGPDPRLQPGIYLLRLTQGRTTRVTRAVVLN